MKKDKDILFLCQYFYPEHNSSATLPFDTAKYLADNGYRVDALVGYPKEYSVVNNVPKNETVDKVNIHRIKYVQLARSKRISRLINYFSFTFSVFLRLFKMKSFKSVVVYSNPPVLPFVPVLANILFKTKIIFVAYDIYPEIAYASNSIMPGSLIDKGMKWINHLLYKRVSTVVALTDEMKDYLLKNRPELDENRVVTIPNWAHENKTEVTDDAYIKFGYKPGQFIVSYFGNMGTCQEMETLVKAVEQLKNNDAIKFLFIGHGNKKEDIQKRFEDQHLKNIQMYDFLTGEAFEQAVAISSCCVVSLEKGLKGMCAPSKYYSYLQGGKPVIAVVEKGSYLEKEICKEQLGNAVEIGDSEEMVSAIVSLCKNKSKREQISKKVSQIYEEKYRQSIGLASYFALIEELLNDGSIK